MATRGALIESSSSFSSVDEDGMDQRTLNRNQSHVNHASVHKTNVYARAMHMDVSFCSTVLLSRPPSVLATINKKKVQRI